jgi:hypothetical protein
MWGLRVRGGVVAGVVRWGEGEDEGAGMGEGGGDGGYGGGEDSSAHGEAACVPSSYSRGVWSRVYTRAWRVLL